MVKMPIRPVPDDPAGGAGSYGLWRALRPVVAGLGVGLSAFTTCQAADWWSTVDASTRTKVAIDVDRLACRGGVCTAPQEAGARDGAHGATIGQLVDYDCSGLRVRGGAAGQVSAAGWRPVAANSLAEAMLTFACTYDQRKAGLGEDDTLNADGRTFKRAAASPGVAANRPEPAKAVREAQPGAPVQGALDGGSVVQIAAAVSQGLAAGELDTLNRRQPDLMRGLTTRVEAAQTGGRQVFRALIVGLPSTQTAQRLCATLKRRAVACFVRTGP